MRLLLLFTLVLSTAHASYFTLEQRAAAPRDCEEHGGEAVCCDGDPIDWGSGVLHGCDKFDEKLTKCEHPEMVHCCGFIIFGKGIHCDETQAPTCPVPEYKKVKRHLRQRAEGGCLYSPPATQSQAPIEWEVVDGPETPTYDDGSSEIFFADGYSNADESTSDDLWSESPNPTLFDDGSLDLSPGGNEYLASGISGDDSSLGFLPDASDGASDYTESPNLFLDG